MARSREDYPGALHHITNRGIAKRTVFETEDDVRYFQSRLAWEAKRGEIELHAFLCLTTHFHLLLRSLRGNLHAVMRRVMSAYVRWFNRRRKRDGPLFRGRYFSRIVDSHHYRTTLYRYIDENPVLARVVDDPARYPYGSAWWYARKKGPRWLDRSWAMAQAMAAAGRDHYEPADYARLFGKPLKPGQREWIERKVSRRGPADEPGELDVLLNAPPAQVREWLEWKTQLADGTSPFQLHLPPELVENAVARHRVHAWYDARGGDCWDVLLAGLLRDACDAAVREVARRLGVHPDTARQRVCRHRRLLKTDRYYARKAAQVLRCALDELRGD